jgi:hypothetical protein
MTVKGLTGITDMLNLPSLDEVLKENGIDVDAAPTEPDEQKMAQTVEKLHDLSARMAMITPIRWMNYTRKFSLTRAI